MTKSLTLNEMLDVIHMTGDLELHKAIAARLDAIGDEMGEHIAAKLGVDFGHTNTEPSAFAGTCGTFMPKFAGQPCPDPLDQFDPSEWGDDDAPASSPVDETPHPMLKADASEIEEDSEEDDGRPKWLIRVEVTEIFEATISADSEEEAREDAMTLFPEAADEFESTSFDWTIIDVDPAEGDDEQAEE